MSVNFNSLEELKRKKKLLQAEVDDLEAILTFKNAKESLSAFTNGFTDQYLKEKTDDEGEEKTVLRTDVIAKQVSSEVKNMIFSKNAAFGLANTALKGDALEGLLKLGATALVANYAKKNMSSSNWKKKAIGVAMIYLAPLALKFLRNKLEAYQKTKSVSSMEQLI